MPKPRKRRAKVRMDGSDVRMVFQEGLVLGDRAVQIAGLLLADRVLHQRPGVLSLAEGVRAEYEVQRKKKCKVSHIKPERERPVQLFYVIKPATTPRTILLDEEHA